MINFYCTYCGQHIEASEDLVSTDSVCPSCGEEIEVPHINSNRQQSPSSDPRETTSEGEILETLRDPSLPVNRREADTSLGGKMLSLMVSGILILGVFFFSRQYAVSRGEQAAEREISKRLTTQANETLTQVKLVKFDLAGLTIKLPGRPNKRVIPIPESVKSTLKSKDSYLFQNGTQTISFARDVFIEEVDFASRCDIIFEHLKSTDQNATKRQYYVAGASGMRFTFDPGNKNYCDLLLLSRGTTVWQVQVLNRASRTHSTKKLSDAIFSSIIVLPTDLATPHLEATLDAKAFLDFDRTAFSTLNHKKANGLNMEFSYPNNWVAKEGEKPHVVQKFVSESGLEIAMISVRSIPAQAGTIATEEDMREFFAEENLKGMIPEGAKIITSKLTKIEGLPAEMTEYSAKGERLGMVIEAYSINFMFINESNLVSVNFSIMSSPDSVSKTKIEERITEFRPIFMAMANTISLPDKWK